MVSRDFLGNTVITSLEHDEYTLAGISPATIIASSEGKHIIATNQELLSKIQNGSISHARRSWYGYESRVYQITLQKDNDYKTYALKYTFPTNKSLGIFTSGIVAMRMMQLAEKERPVPYIRYTVPIFATHDITVSPFVHNGLSISDMMSWINSSEDSKDDSSFMHDNNLTLKQKQIIRTMKYWEHEALKDTMLTFKYHIITVLNSQKQILCDWVNTQINRYPEFNMHRYDASDTTLMQSVVNLDDMYNLGQQFYNNQRYNSSNPTFVSSVLKTLSLVELGIGRD